MKKKFINLLLAIGMVLGLTVDTITTLAAVVPVDPETNMFDELSSLVVQKNAKISRFDFDTTIPDSNLDVLFKGSNLPEAHDAGAQYPNTDLPQNIYNARYPSFPEGSESYLFEIEPAAYNNQITTYHGNTGIYDGKNVDIKLKFYNFEYLYWASNSPNTKEKMILEVNRNPYNGYVYHNIKDANLDITIIDSETKQEVELIKTTFLTFNSLDGKGGYANGAEWVMYLNNNVNSGTSPTNAYVTTDTNVAYTNVDATGLDKAFAGVSDDFEDKLGSHNFSRNSVSFELSGTTQKFKFGNQTGGLVWNTISTAQVDTPPPGSFTKNIFDPETGEEINGQPVSAGQNLDYVYDFEIHELGSQINQKYKRYEVIDRLPEGLTFTSGNVYDSNGKDITTAAGKFVYDTETNEAKYVFSADYLKNGFKYDYGEAYKVIFHTKVNDDVKDGELIENFSHIIINNAEFEGNGTENPTYPPNKVTKKVLDSDGKTELEERVLENGEKEVTFRVYGTMNEKPNTSAIRFVDKLEDPFEFKAIQFMLDKKDVTADFVRDEKVVDNLLQYDVKSDAVSKYIGKQFYADITVKVKDNYDLSSYPESKIPNDAYIVTNFDTAVSDKVHVIPSPEALKISKGVFNELGEVVEYYQLQSNSERIHYTSSFVVPNAAAKDYYTKEVVWFDDLDAALRFDGKDGDIVVTDADGNDVTKNAEFSTKNNGQNITLTWTGDNAKEMAGQSYTVDFYVYYREGTDLSAYPGGVIPNRANVKVTIDNNGEEVTEEESNEVSIVPIPETEAPQKFVLNDEGLPVVEKEMNAITDIETFAGKFLIPNDKKLKEVSYFDKLPEVLELVELRVYANDSKETEIYNSVKDKEVNTKGTFSYSKDSNIWKYSHNKDSLQDLAGTSTYVEFDVKVKDGADLSGLTDGKIINENITMVINGEETPSGPAAIVPPTEDLSIVKKWEVDNKFIDHFENAEIGEALPMVITVTMPNNKKLTKFVVQDPLQEGLTTTVDAVNETKVASNGKDVTDQWEVAFNKDTNTITYSIIEKYLTEYQGGQKVEFHTPIYLDSNVDVSKDQNFKNVAYAYVNDSKDPEKSNEITVDTEADVIDKIEKFYLNIANNNALEDSLTITDLDATYTWLLKATVTSKPGEKVVIEDELPKDPEMLKFTGKPVAYILDSKNEKIDITEKGVFNVEGRKLSFTLTAAEYAKLNNQVIYVQFDTVPTEEAVAGASADNVGRLTVDEKELPEVKVPIDVHNEVDSNIIEKYYDNNGTMENKLTITDLKATYPFILKATIKETPKESVVITDILPEMLAYTGTQKAYVIDSSNEKIDITEKGKFVIDGQKMTFTLTASAYKEISNNVIYVRYETKPTDKAVPGVTADNVAQLTVDNNKTPEVKLPINVPKESTTDSSATTSSGSSASSGKASSDGKTTMPQTGEKYAVTALAGLLALLVILAAVVYYRERKLNQ